MNISEAIKKYGLSEKKMLKLLNDNKVRGLRINNDGSLSIPDRFAVPYVIPSNAKNTDENCFKYILLAINEHKYIDNKLLFGITFEMFSHYVELLEKGKYTIKEVEECGMDNYILTPEVGLKAVKEISNASGNRLKIKLKSLVDLGGINTQVGIVNISIG
jgi:hypothetical protein